MSHRRETTVGNSCITVGGMAKGEMLTVRVDKPVLDRLTRMARDRGITRGELLRRVILEKIKEEG